MGFSASPLPSHILSLCPVAPRCYFEGTPLLVALVCMCFLCVVFNWIVVQALGAAAPGTGTAVAPSPPCTASWEVRGESL